MAWPVLEDWFWTAVIEALGYWLYRVTTRGAKTFFSEITVSSGTTSHNSLVALVHAGLGIAVLPLFYKREGLVCLDNLSCESSLKFYLCAHKNVKDIPRVRAVINFYTAMLDKIAEV